MKSSKNYWPRLADEALREKLSDVPAVLVRGPKWCGKTSTCSQIAASSLMLRDPGVFQNSVNAAQVQPSLLLRGAQPRLLDEWQLLPVLWDAVINEADKAGGAPGQYLLTGSATPPNPSARKHTGTGRIARVDMSTMTLEESRESTCEVSLAALFAGVGLVEGESSLSVENYSRIICRGGWPALVARGGGAGGLVSDYIDALCETDIAEASGEGIDPGKAHALIRSLSRSVSQEASNVTILADVRDAGTGMSEPTLRKYVEVLRRMFVVRELKAWAPTLRSRTPLRSSRTWHLCDPSLAAAALETNEDGLLNDLETMGYLFESLCVRDLRVYAHLLGGDVYHYRDKSGLEADAIVRLRDGRWAGFEVNLGGEERIDEGARHLLALADRVDARRTGSPSFLAVLTGGRYAYTRADGVHVIPLGCLCSG